MIDLTVQQLEKAERALEHIPGAVPRAAANAINRAADSAKTEAARKVRETYYIKHGDVLSTIKIYGASAGDLSATVISRGSVIALTKFRVTPRQPQPKKRRTVIVRVKKGEGGPIQGAFIAGMNSGHVNVFNRIGKSRLPIVGRYGPSVPQMIGSDDVRIWVEDKSRERLESRLDHEISRILGANG